MSFKVTKLIVGKGKTSGDEKEKEWTRRYFEVEVSVEDEHEHEHDIELARTGVEGLIDGWLTGTWHYWPGQEGFIFRRKKKNTQECFLWPDSGLRLKEMQHGN